MLILDKWTLKDTLVLLTHPERVYTAKEHQLREEARRIKIAIEKRAEYERAYKRLIDEIEDELRDSEDDGQQEVVWRRPQ